MDFHDGLLLNMAFDVQLCSAEIILSIYLDEESKTRSIFCLTFGGVSHISFVADLDEMKRNEFAGTIVSMRERKSDKTTRIYLTGGIIIARSKTLLITPKLKGKN